MEQVVELQQLLGTFGAAGALIWVLWQQSTIIQKVMAHNQALIDKLIDKRNGSSINGGGSADTVKHTA